jgi:hypothetical protein
MLSCLLLHANLCAFALRLPSIITAQHRMDKHGTGTAVACQDCLRKLPRHVMVLTQSADGPSTAHHT